MPSLGDAYDGAADEWARRRLYLGAALLFVGAVVAAPGLVRVTADALVAAGLEPAAARSLGIALAGVVVPVAGAGLLLWLPAGRQLRVVAGSGVLVATLAVGAFVATVPSASLAGPADVPLGVLAVYTLGAMAALWSPVVAAGLAAGEGAGRPERSMSTTAFVRDRPSRGPTGRVPADGGEDSQELTFLLDDDDR